MSDSLDLQQALALARQAAEAGAAIAMKKRASSEQLTVQAKGKADWVTDVDHAAQAAIIERIGSQYPNHRFLAEEEGADALGDPASPFRWIIDPLDGTTPYIHGKDTFGTIIALQENNETLLGVIIIPVKNEHYWGMRGQGTFFNGTRITSLRATQSFDDAIVCTNLGRHAPAFDLSTFRCASLQNYGCAAVEFTEILKGCNDAVLFSEGPRLWDTEAGCLLIKEAGGQSRRELIDPANQRGSVRCVASTAPIFDELCAFVFRKT